MVLSMFGFALEDMFVKAASAHLPIGEILILFGAGGTLLFSFLVIRKGDCLVHRDLLSRPIILRVICEITGRLFFIFAIVLTPLSSASAILQTTPLFVVIGASIFFGEHVGWRRWLAILLGLVGVLMILQPGLEGFEMASLLAVIGTIGFAGRDLATRAAPPTFSNMQLGVYGFIVLIPTGLLVVPMTGGLVWPDAISMLKIFGAVFFGVIAYYALTIAMRSGEVSVVTPFRYTRLIFAMILGIMIFAEKPDIMILSGSLLVVVSGVYSLINSVPKKSHN